MSAVDIRTVDICALADLPRCGAISVRVGEHQVAVVSDDGAVYAIADRCSHADVALSEGDVENGTIECWLHGSAFDLTTGVPVCLPATEPVPVYQVSVDGTGPEARVQIQVAPDGAPIPVDHAAAAAAPKE